MRRWLNVFLFLLSATMLMARGTDRVKYPGGKSYMFRIELKTRMARIIRSTDRNSSFLSGRLKGGNVRTLFSIVPTCP